MTSEDRGSSDPLPYTQVDRSVKPKAVLLSQLLSTTTQHALGSLIEFWDLNGDPREIEALIAQGKHEVVLSGEKAKLRFKLASSKDVEPAHLEELGLLEKVEDGYRVRGMSRYFAPVEARLVAREKSRAGGLASVAARRAKNGTAQPQRHDAASNTGSGAGSEQVRGGFGAGSDPASEVVKPTRNPPEVSGQRTADSGQRTAKEEEAPSPNKPLPAPPVPKTPGDPFASAEAFWAHTQALRHEAGGVVEKPPGGLSAWWSEVGMELNGAYELLGPALERFGGNAFWKDSNPPWPFGAFMKGWRDYVRR